MEFTHDNVDPVPAGRSVGLAGRWIWIGWSGVQLDDDRELVRAAGPVDHQGDPRHQLEFLPGRVSERGEKS